jgi:hypothetical protein
MQPSLILNYTHDGMAKKESSEQILEIGAMAALRFPHNR